MNRKNAIKLLEKQSPKEIKIVWLWTRITTLILMLVFGIVVKITTTIMKLNNGWLAWGLLVYFTVVALSGICYLVVIPWEYNYHRYQVFDDYLAFQKGLFFRSTTYVPFIRIQHIIVDQGPFLRMKNLASLTIHTAATDHEIVGLKYSDATWLREEILQKVKQVENDV